METLFKKYFGIILFFAAVVFVLRWIKQHEKEQIEQNKGVSVAQIMHIGRRNRLYYRFLYDKKWHKGSERGGRNTSKNDYYKVEFDKSDPSTSNLILSQQSLNPMDLVEEGIEIQGRVEKIRFPSKTHLDLYVNYKYLDETYSVRTRMHKDSLPCGKVADCTKAEITLKISPYFPNLNNLYYDSYDRSEIRKKLNERFKK
ncbi:MAG: hypothetical protein AAGD88_08005 [Bacteroidota bacterium]